MKTLSIIMVGGRRLCRLIMAIVVVVCLNSCDIWYLLPFNNDDHLRRIDVPTETGNVVIHCTYRADVFSLWFRLNGEYVLNPDSLKLIINNEKMERNPKFVADRKTAKNIIHVKDSSFTIKIGVLYLAEKKNYQKPWILTIPPSDYILCNGKRVLNDTLRVLLTTPKEDPYLWKKETRKSQ